MKNGMPLDALLTEVRRQNLAKRDFVSSTKDAVRLVDCESMPHKVACVLLRDGAAELERFEISDHAHKQIAAKLEVPVKYYWRLLDDHRDLLIDQVNALFEREPAARLFRVLDGKLRAFLSDRYLRLDNAQVLEQTLPAIVKGDIQTKLLNCNVGEQSMDMKVLFTDDRFAQEITSATRTGETRVIRPGFHMRNSEVGSGSLGIKGFFFDGYCDNGTVYRMVDGFEFSRTHIGGRLIEGVNFEVLSQKSRELEDATIISQVSDVMHAMATPEFSQQMGDVLRRTASTPGAKDPVAAVDLAVRELGLAESERSSVLQTFIGDGDYSQWGLAAAVTATANRDEVSYERATELEDIGGKLLTLQLRDWSRYVNAEPVRLAA